METMNLQDLERAIGLMQAVHEAHAAGVTFDEFAWSLVNRKGWTWNRASDEIEILENALGLKFPR